MYDNFEYIFKLKCNVNSPWSVRAIKPLIYCQASEGFFTQTHTRIEKQSVWKLSELAVWHFRSLYYQTEPQYGYLTELLGRVNEKTSCLDASGFGGKEGTDWPA